jgi:metal-sulfur cluster biosynthetic enzyme
MNGGIKENANPTVRQVQKSASRHKALLGWTALQETLNDAARDGNQTQRAILLALQDASDATAGKGVSILRNAGLDIPERDSSRSKSVYIPLEFGGFRRSRREEHAAERAQIVRDEIDADEIFDVIRNIQDPEHPLTLEQLSVVSRGQVTVQAGDSGIFMVDVRFTPTIPHCSMATLIGLCIRVKLLRSLPGSDRFKVTVRIEPGTHNSETSVNKQLADKERVCAALENKHLLGVVNKCLSAGAHSLDS